MEEARSTQGHLIDLIDPFRVGIFAVDLNHSFILQEDKNVGRLLVFCPLVSVI